jgi:predicted secreted protein
MRPLNPAVRILALLAWTLSAPSWAAPLIVELSAEASRPAANDQLRATLFAEASGATPGELSAQVNKSIGDALKTAKAYPAIKTQSGNTATYPIYAKSGKIEAWRMRSELALESGDSAALGELLGKLQAQASLGIANLVLQPSPETRKKIESEAMVDAIAAFKARAKTIADALGMGYRIKQLAVSTSGRNIAPLLRANARTMAADAAPMPVEAGESQVGASVSGQIEVE